MKLTCIENSYELAKKVSDELGIKISNTTKKQFKDGEFTVGYDESVRGDTVYIIGSTNTLRGEDNLMELCMKIRAAKLANAKEIIVIIPYFGWGRADRKDIDRSCVTSKLVSEFIEISGATHIITFDLHAIQTQSFFDISSDNFTMDSLYANHIINTYNIDNVIIASPDMGGSKRVSKVAGLLNTDLVIFYKERNKNNEIEKMKVLGDVKDRDVIFIDDIADSAKTMATASSLAKENGAKKIVAYCTHGVLSGQAIETIEKSDIDDFYITDSIKTDLTKSTKIKVISMAKTISKIILKINSNFSLSKL